ncbi:T9SS type A sorting domain-containing protein [Bacteroidales bacterium OttesenSCG-928-A17]|nr:T9SS type A sorting domain-containing protein [Bacteroidales bacterium OttesenSCG-928-A17]
MRKFILCIALCVFVITNSFAQSYSGGDGSENNPYLISSYTDMETLATTVNNGNSYSGKYFSLTQNLINENNIITTIIGNSSSNYFSGIFNGNNNDIRLNIKVKNGFGGLFGFLRNATILNVNTIGIVEVSSTSNSSGSRAGGISGHAENSFILNCHNKADITSNYYNLSYTYTAIAGGICGHMTLGCTVSYCSNEGNVLADASASRNSESYSGGICGYFFSSGTIEKCSNIGVISATSRDSHSGGICGRTEARQNKSDILIQNSYNLGAVNSTASGMSYAGGIAGRSGQKYNTSCKDKIISCYNNGDIYSISTNTQIGSSYAGGIYCGFSNSIAIDCFSSNQIIKCTSNQYQDYGKINANRNSVENNTDNINCFSSESMLLNGGFSNIGNNEPIFSFSSEFWIEQNLQWDFAETWEMSFLECLDKELPTLISLTDIKEEQSYSGGDGSSQLPYLISSKTDMRALATAVKNGENYANKYFLLINDIVNENDSIGRIIADSENFYFSGHFDGNGHTIALNLKSTKKYIGLFGNIKDATIKNLTVKGCIISNSLNSSIGGICGNAESSGIVNCVSLCDISASYRSKTTSSLYVGGICGEANFSIIQESKNEGDVESINFFEDGDFVDNFYSKFIAGGVCGYAYKSTKITNCLNNGDISATSSGGGICGYGYDSIDISFGINNGNISAKSSAGGICGYFDTSSNIEKCYNAGLISTNLYVGGILGFTESSANIDNCLNVNHISGIYAGGILGGTEGSYANVNINNSYNIGNILGKKSAGGICGILGRGKIENCFTANDKVECLTVFPYNWGRRILGGDGSYGSVENCFALQTMMVNNSLINSQDAWWKEGKDEYFTNFQSQSWIEENIQWNFNTIWEMSDINSPNKGLPILKKNGDNSNSIESLRLSNSNNVHIYPNPTSHTIKIESDSPISKVELYNHMGGIMLSESGFIDKIDISSFPNGIYIVKIYLDGTVVNKKIIVKK